MKISLWKRIVASTVVALCGIALSACAITEGGCRWTRGAPGSKSSWECSARGKTSLTTSQGDAIASQVVFDYGGSTVEFPQTGSVTIKLRDAAGVLRATQRHPWVRSGTLIYLQNPAVVDQWLSTYAGQRGSVEFQLDRAPVIAMQGANRFRVSTLHNGIEVSSAMTSFVCLTNCGGPPGPVDP